MPRRTTKTAKPVKSFAVWTAEPVESFPAWKARVLAGLDKITAGTVRERDLRQLYIKGNTPEEAAQEANYRRSSAQHGSVSPKKTVVAPVIAQKWPLVRFAPSGCVIRRAILTP